MTREELNLTIAKMIETFHEVSRRLAEVERERDHLAKINSEQCDRIWELEQELGEALKKGAA